MTISNSEIARIFREIGECLEMQEVPFKPRAYKKVAEMIAGLDEELSEIYRRGGLGALNKMPGVGVSMAEKIEELIKTNRLRYYEDLKKKIPVNLRALTQIEGLGPKKIKKLYQALKIKNIEDLEKAVKSGKIRNLKDFGLKSEENFLKSIEFLKNSADRFILGFEMAYIREIESRLKKLKEVEKIVIAGSVRRRKETIGNVDILIISKKPKTVMEYFVSMPDVMHTYVHSEIKLAVKMKNGLDVNLRVVPEECYGAALNYFTGSKDYNIALREIALKKGYKLNEYGLFRILDKRGQQLDQFEKTNMNQRRSRIGQREIMVAGRTEEEIYKALEMDYIEPEMRENTGEIELAFRQAQGNFSSSKLPKLIGYDDLRGDLQIQTNWTDGINSIEEMARAAIALGLEYIAITDHTKHLAMVGGLSEKKIQQQWREIDYVNSKLISKGGQNSKFKILKGTECDILKDGSLDLPDKILAKLEVVGASVHSYFNLSRKEQTERIKRAMANPHVDIIFHPTGRIINRRKPYEIDIDEIIAFAKKTGTILEIDAYPDRSDLKDEHIRKCVEAGVKMAIDSDAHSVTHLSYLEYGIAQARRGWATKNNIINAWPLEKMLKFLKK